MGYLVQCIDLQKHILLSENTVESDDNEKNKKRSISPQCLMLE